MPHLDLTQEEMDRLHPSLIPPDDEQLDDLASDENDAVHQKGLKLAEAIRDETSLVGRMRRPLLARIQEQQHRRHDVSRMHNRTRTIRTFGGGVLSGAATSVLLPATTVPTAIPDTTTAVGPERLVPYGNSPGPPHHTTGTTTHDDDPTTTAAATAGAVVVVVAVVEEREC